MKEKRSDPVESGNEDPLLNEDQRIKKSTVQQQGKSRAAGGSMKQSSLQSPSVVKKKDPNKEFFQMCLLSHKLNNQNVEAVMELDHRELYNKCVDIDK